MMDAGPMKPIHKPRTVRLLHLRLSAEVYKRLQAHAGLRGWPIEMLAAELLTKIAHRQPDKRGARR